MVVTARLVTVSMRARELAGSPDAIARRTAAAGAVRTGLPRAFGGGSLRALCRNGTRPG